jgi:hypothetical protein
MDVVEGLFGPGDGMSEPWHQYHKCECKEVAHFIVDFLHCTAGLDGEKHDSHGWIIDFKLWSGLMKYIRWCEDEKLDFMFHVSRVQEGDSFYISRVCSKFEEFNAVDSSAS